MDRRPGGPEREDGELERPEPRSYRCPACGHRDTASMDGKGSALIRCTHCDTSLIAARKGVDALAVTVAGNRSRRAREPS